LWLLDVDGVLNVLARSPSEGAPPPAGWLQWRSGEAVADGVPWPIRFAPSLAERVRRLHERGAVECRWLTTWGDDANEGLRRLLGLPAFDVVPVPGETREWWKLAAARALLAREPRRRLVWTDDELGRHPEAVAWARGRRAPSLLLSPRPEAGLTPRDLREVEWFCRPRTR
jgi:hypothetical protein